MSSFVKIDDLGTTLVDYMKAKIKADLPNTDLSDNSPLMDILIYPWATIGAQLTTFGTNIELRTNLTNAANLTDEEVDDIGEGNYFTERGEGTKSVGSVTFSFDAISEVQPTIIPEGLSVGTKTGLNFIVTETMSFTPAEMFTKWDGSDMTYKITAPAEAEAIGETYNVAPGLVTVLNNAFTIYPVKVVNNASFIGGLDQETKESYLARIKAFYSSRTLETKNGYKQQILETFPEVTGVAVAGYGDALMQRDLADSITIGGVIFDDYHIGGKVDIYVKGTEIKTASLSYIARTPRLPFAQPQAKIDTGSIVITNTRTMGVIPGAGITYSTRAGVYIASVNDGLVVHGDTLRVTYNYDADGNGSFEASATENHLVNPSLHERPIIGPFVSGISLVNKTTLETFDIGYGTTDEGTYEIWMSDDALIGSSREAMTFTPVDPAINAVNGDVIEFTYSYNQTVKDIGAFYDAEGNRVITRDVLIRKAIEAYFFIEMEVKLLPGVIGNASVESALFNTVAAFLSRLDMNAKIDESDVINEVYQNTDTAVLIDYIKVALKTFHKTNDPNEAFVSGVRDGTSIQLGAVEFPSLHTLQVIYL